MCVELTLHPPVLLLPKNWLWLIFLHFIISYTVSLKTGFQCKCNKLFTFTVQNICVCHPWIHLILRSETEKNPSSILFLCQGDNRSRRWTVLNCSHQSMKTLVCFCTCPGTTASPCKCTVNTNFTLQTFTFSYLCHCIPVRFDRFMFEFKCYDCSHLASEHSGHIWKIFSTFYVFYIASCYSLINE